MFWQKISKKPVGKFSLFIIMTWNVCFRDSKPQLAKFDQVWNIYPCFVFKSDLFHFLVSLGKVTCAILIRTKHFSSQNKWSDQRYGCESAELLFCFMEDHLKLWQLHCSKTKELEFPGREDMGLVYSISLLSVLMGSSNFFEFSVFKIPDEYLIKSWDFMQSLIFFNKLKCLENGTLSSWITVL